MKYTIISPVNNEAEFISHTLDSVVDQSILPIEWIIVDDGSSDNTLEIIRTYSKKYGWIKIIENGTHHEKRSGGIKVVKAFYKGFDSIKKRNYDFIVKLDGDLKLPKNYFETVISTFKNNKKVGICGGYILNKIGNSLLQEGPIDYHVRGAFKSVRKECFDQIGGFPHIWSWDGLDEMEAMRLGWETSVFDLAVVHYRPTSSAYDYRKQNFTHGIEAYKTRDNLILTIIRFLVKSAKKPYLSGCYFFKGYTHGFFMREPRIISKELSQFTNKFHLNRILSIIFSR